MSAESFRATREVQHAGLARRGDGRELSVTGRGIGLDPDELGALSEQGVSPGARFVVWLPDAPDAAP